VLLEVLPWVHQWHAEINTLYGAAPGDIYDRFLDAQLGELQLSRQQLAKWRPDGRVDDSNRRTGLVTREARGRPRQPRPPDPRRSATSRRLR